MASPSSGFDEEDEELQRALALSLEEARSGVGGAASADHAKEDAAPSVSPRATRRQPMRGRRTPAAKPPQQLQRQPQQAASALQQHQQEEAAPEELAAATQRQQQRQQQQQQQQRQQQQQQRLSPAPAMPAVSKPPPAIAGGRKPRGKKLPAYNPTDAEVEACFKLLAGGGSTASVGSLIEASQALGCGQELPTVQLMMAHAAEHVLGWASGAARGQGARGQLSLHEFRAVVDHFRVAG